MNTQPPAPPPVYIAPLPPLSTLVLPPLTPSPISIRPEPLQVLASVSAKAPGLNLGVTHHPSTQSTSRISKKSRSFPCNLCTSTFSERFNLNKHIRAVHERRRPFECPTCHARFQQRDHMQKHEACVHKKLRLFECPSCGAAFGWRGVLKKHRRSSACVPKQFQHQVVDQSTTTTTTTTSTSTTTTIAAATASARPSAT